MSSYKVKTGHNQAADDLVLITPQPRSKGIQYTRRTVSGDGTIINEGPFVEFVWDTIANKTMFQSILTQFGLASVYSALVTVSVRGDNFDYARKNGKALRPTPGDGVEWDIFPRNLTIIVRDLSTAS